MSTFHALFPHSLDWLYVLLDWPMNTGPNGGYNFWSGPVGDTAVVGGFLLILRRLNCAAPWCPRIGHHLTADGHHKLCRKHHPDLPNEKLSLEEIHARHYAAMPPESAG